MSRSYKPIFTKTTVENGKILDKPRWKVQFPRYLSGLFTHRYEGVLYLQFRCPLCGDKVQVARQLKNNMPVDYEKHVAGEMANQLRIDLAEHYKTECGSDRERRSKTGEMLFDKFMDEVYE